MAGELAEVAAAATPLAVAAARIYGRTVLAKAWDDLGDVSVKAGVRLLQCVFGKRKQGEELPPVVIEVIMNPDDGDYAAQLRLAIRKAMESSKTLAGEIADILNEVRTMTQAAQHVTSGRDSSVNYFARDGFIAGRDIKFFHPPAGDLSSCT